MGSIWSSNAKPAPPKTQGAPKGSAPVARIPRLIADQEKQRQTMVGTTDVTLPPTIQAQDIVDGQAKAREEFCLSLKERGYALLRGNKETLETSEALEQKSLEFFKLANDEKMKNGDAMNNNVGYVLITGVREYIKLRPFDPPELWPQAPADFKTAYDSFFASHSKVAFSCFETLAHYIDQSDPTKKPLLNKDEIEAIQEFITSKSSVSMIHYFAHKFESACVCSEHKDTGLLTFIIRTKFPALEMWDKSVHKYVKLEEMTEVGDLIVFMGEKIPLFSTSKIFLATPHRVNMGPDKDRLSMAFLLDVAK